MARSSSRPATPSVPFLVCVSMLCFFVGGEEGWVCVCVGPAASSRRRFRRSMRCEAIRSTHPSIYIFSPQTPTHPHTHTHYFNQFTVQVHVRQAKQGLGVVKRLGLSQVRPEAAGVGREGERRLAVAEEEGLWLDWIGWLIGLVQQGLVVALLSKG